MFSAGELKGEVVTPITTSDNVEFLQVEAKRWNAYQKSVGFVERIKVKRIVPDCPDLVGVFCPISGLGPHPQDTGSHDTKIPISGIEWRIREHNRQTDAETTLPWGDMIEWGKHPERTLHYPRPARKEGMLAYTPSEEYGIDDRQLVVKPASYLFKHFSSWSDVYIENMAAEFIAAHRNVDVKFAMTREEIRDVYRNGPRSCMGGGGEDFCSDDHPCIVYAAGDLAVAYLMDDDEYIKGRCVVWPDKKIRSRIYGSAILKVALEDMGYCPGEFYGARISKIPDTYNPGSYLMPYLDGDCGVADCGDHFEVVDDLSIRMVHPADGVSGTTGRCSRCIWCENAYPERDMHGGLCDDCSNSAVACVQCGDFVRETRQVRTDGDGDQEWCVNCSNWHASQCMECEEYYAGTPSCPSCAVDLAESGDG